MVPEVGREGCCHSAQSESTVLLWDGVGSKGTQPLWSGNTRQEHTGHRAAQGPGRMEQEGERVHDTTQRDRRFDPQGSPVSNTVSLIFLNCG